MNLRRSVLLIVILTSLIILIAGAGYFFSLAEQVPVDFIQDDGRVDYAKSTAYWTTMIASDPDHAFAYMVEIGNQLNDSQSHVLAHSFGEAAYRAFGATGLTKCGNDFIYGCFHQFMGTALAEGGTAIIDSTLDACNLHNREGICLHGIGHGLVGHIGYDQDDLKEALAVCDELDTDIPSACYSGVFMEYNHRQMAGESTEFVVSRPFTPETPYEPCATQVAPQQRSACYREQPNWWVSVLKTDSEERIAEYCLSLEHAHALTCIGGLGEVIGLSADDLNTIKSTCVSVTSSGKQSFLTQCLAGAAHRLSSIGPDQNKKESVCRYWELSDRQLDTCFAYPSRENAPDTE